MPRDAHRPAPARTWRDREKATRVRAVLLDPGLQPAGDPDVYSTAYEPDVLLVGPSQTRERPEDGVDELASIARRLGWSVAAEPLEEPARVTKRKKARPRLPSAARSVRARITVSRDADPSAPVLRPDAWRLLVEARRAGVDGVGLNHVMSLDALGLDPFKANPFKANPFKANPFKANPFKANAGGIESYAYPGFGGRQPVYFAGPDLKRSEPPKGARRPVVAVLDTGCGIHPWFTGDAIVDAAAEYGGAIGIDDPASDPETHPALGDPLDGVFDEAAGHGTFIAGIVLQACPDARILPVRVADGAGIVYENDLLGALGRIVDLVESGTSIDVLNLSLSFYHESPGRASIDGELYDLLSRARRAGCVVVCSAGNDATDRPASPGSLYDWPGNEFGSPGLDESALAPQVVVGALNPSGRSVALFSNIGPWVSGFARGVSILSTLPTVFEGGVQADVRNDEYGRRRETLDLDDFGAGFGVWSGTSFAAPLVAGCIAAELGSVPAGRRAPALLPTSATKAAVAAVLSRFASEDASPLP